MNVKTFLTDCRFFKGEATHVGIFSGKEKLRLEMGDKTKRFAIALIKDKKISDEEKRKNYGTVKNKTWVKLKLDEKGIKVAYADVSSIAKRFGIKESVIKKAAKEGNLENLLQHKIDDYVAVRTFAKKNSKENDSIKILNDLTTLSSEISDNETKVIIKDFIGRFSNINNEDVANRRMETINTLFYSVDKEFSLEVKSFGEKIKIKANKKLEIGGLTLIKKDKVVRLELAENNQNKYAIRTDGYIYTKKPEMTDKYVPYSSDEGKTWVLLDIKSLSYRLAFDPNKTDAIKECLRSLVNYKLDKDDNKANQGIYLKQDIDYRLKLNLQRDNSQIADKNKQEQNQVIPQVEKKEPVKNEGENKQPEKRILPDSSVEAVQGEYLKFDDGLKIPIKERLSLIKEKLKKHKKFFDGEISQLDYLQKITIDNLKFRVFLNRLLNDIIKEFPENQRIKDEINGIKLFMKKCDVLVKIKGKDLKAHEKELKELDLYDSNTIQMYHTKSVEGLLLKIDSLEKKLSVQ